MSDLARLQNVSPVGAEVARPRATVLSATRAYEHAGNGHAARKAASTHVLFMIDELCEMGGAERAMLNTVRLLPKDRFHCSVVTFRVNSSLPVFRDFPCPLHVLPLRRTYDWNAAKVAWKLRDLIRGENVAIVHTMFETSDLWGALVAKCSGGPLVVSSRRDMGILRSAKHRFAYRPMGHLYDLVLTVSEQVRQFCIREDGVNPSKVVTLYNGIETEKLGAKSTGRPQHALNIDPAAPIVMTAAHIRKVKGLDVFIRSAAIVHKEIPSVVFLIAGDSTEKQHFLELQDLTRSLGLTGHVKFLGDQADIIPWYQIADVFCLLSRSEGFSNSLIEAMATGLPCVATRVGGNDEALVEGKSGYLVESEDATSAADRILGLLRNRALARSMGLEGRRVVEEKFTAQAMIRNLVGLYDSLLDSRQR